ncbi:conserved hypothetical protein, partial [Ricinus communis]
MTVHNIRRLIIMRVEAITRRTGAAHVSRAGQRGIGLIGMAAILAALAVGAGAVYLGTQVYWKQRNATDQAVALNWASGLLDNFVLQHGRLPCAASTQLGREDCANADARYLPTRTLLNDVPVSASDLSAAMQQVVYAPYRGSRAQAGAQAGTPAAPDLAARPAMEYIPAVGEIVVAGAPTPGIDGTQTTPMADYAPMALAGTLDFCQKLQNLSLGSGGANAIASLSGGGAPFINPWSTRTTTASAYTISTGTTGSSQTLATPVAALNEALQCEITHASVDVLASAASLSEPDGDVHGLQRGLIGSPSQFGTLEWVTKTLMPQVIAADVLFSGLRTDQLYLAVAKIVRNAVEIPVYILSWDFVDAIMLAISNVFYDQASLRRLDDWAAQVLASLNDLTYLFAYQGQDDRTQAMALWGALSEPDTAVQMA